MDEGEGGAMTRRKKASRSGWYAPKPSVEYTDEDWALIDRAIVRMHDEEGLQWYTIGISTGIEQSTAKRRYVMATGRKPKKNPRNLHMELAARARRLKSRGCTTDVIAERMGISPQSVISLLADLPFEWGKEPI